MSSPIEWRHLRIKNWWSHVSETSIKIIIFDNKEDLFSQMNLHEIFCVEWFCKSVKLGYFVRTYILTLSNLVCRLLFLQSKNCCSFYRLCYFESKIIQNLSRSQFRNLLKLDWDFFSPENIARFFKKIVFIYLFIFWLFWFVIMNDPFLIFFAKFGQISGN